MKKVNRKTLDDGSEVHSFRTLLHHLATITRDQCCQHGDGDTSHTFSLDTKPNAKQQHALDLLAQITL